jgi:hypothetical protein
MVNQSKVNDFRSRISKLPPAEVIASMSRTELVDLKKRVDRLMFDLDLSNDSRTNGYAVRNMIDKGLPPNRAPLLAGSWYGKAILTADKRKLVKHDPTEDEIVFRDTRNRLVGDDIREDLGIKDHEKKTPNQESPKE